MHVVVMGLGISGRAAVRYLLGCGARVSVSDSRSRERMKAEELEFLSASGVSLECGGHSGPFLQQADMIMASPGIPLDLPVLMAAKERGIPVVGELAIAGPAITAKVIAITGTNGKTTVTSLIGELLQRAGKKVFVGGNIGTPLFEYLCKPTPVDVVVLEVSSFQLETAGDFRPDVALLLNITPDHLDRHGDMEGYIAAKRRIFVNQHRHDIAILGGDDPLCREMAAGLTDRVPLLFGHGPDCQARISPDRIAVNLDGVTESYIAYGYGAGRQYRGVEQRGGDPGHPCRSAAHTMLFRGDSGNLFPVRTGWRRSVKSTGWPSMTTRRPPIPGRSSARCCSLPET